MSLIELCLPGSPDMIQVDPDFGGRLTRLVLNGQSVLKYPLRANEPAKGFPSAFLFPYANRVKDGKFVFKGETYKLEVNDLEGNCAIHGIIAEEPFEVVERSENRVFLLYEYNGHKKAFPFPFRFGVEYVLSKGQLEVRIGVRNTGTGPLPFSVGWHPYFGFDDEAIGNMSVELPERKLIEVDERRLPSGTSSPRSSEELPLRHTLLDTIFEVKASGEYSEVKLKFEEKVLSVEQKTGPEGLNYFVLYTPPSRNCIGIEPQTGNADALNNLEGLIVLEPEKGRSFEVRISLK